HPLCFSEWIVGVDQMIGKWIFKQLMRFQVYLYRRSGGKMAGRVRGMPLLLLTTAGRKSGEQHVTPVMYIRDGDPYLITASNRHQQRPRENPKRFLELKGQPPDYDRRGEQNYRRDGAAGKPGEKSPPVAAVGEAGSHV